MCSFSFFRKLICSLLVAVFISCGGQPMLAGGIQEKKDTPQPDPATRWEKAITGFEQLDRKDPPPKGEVLFLGSSSIRMWKLNKWFPKRNFLNRGFGGSEISDSIYFFDRIVRKYQPRTIVFYAGDNDIAKGKNPETVLADFRKFVNKVDQSLPKTRIIFIAIKPSLARWKLVGPMREANGLIRKFAHDLPRVEFADIDQPMIGKDGLPRKELFMKDGLHLNETGYQVWYDVIHPLLK